MGGQSTRERERERERERVHPCNVCDKATSLCKCLASTTFDSTVSMCFPAKVVEKSSTLTTSSTDTINLCWANLTTGRVFATSPCGARTTIEEIILNLNVWGQEERKRTVLASSRKLGFQLEVRC